MLETPFRPLLLKLASLSRGTVYPTFFPASHNTNTMTTDKTSSGSRANPILINDELDSQTDSYQPGSSSANVCQLPHWSDEDTLYMHLDVHVDARSDEIKSILDKVYIQYPCCT